MISIIQIPTPPIPHMIYRCFWAVGRPKTPYVVSLSPKLGEGLGWGIEK
jgi:hypothetical protein